MRFASEIRLDHAPRQRGEVERWRKPKFAARAGRVADQQRRIDRAEECRVDANANAIGIALHADFVGAGAGPIQRDVDGGERGRREVADARRDAGRKHVVVAVLTRGHRSHRGDVVGRVAEVALRIEVAERDRLLASQV